VQASGEELAVQPCSPSALQSFTCKARAGGAAYKKCSLGQPHSPGAVLRALTSGS